MTAAWAQVDLWAAQQAAPAQRANLTGPGWRAFADLVPTTGLREPYRCYAHPADGRVIVVKRPCAYAPGKWRSWRVAKNRLQPRELPAAVWVQVLVALDAWLDGGCKVMRDPTRIDLPVTP